MWCLARLLTSVWCVTCEPACSLQLQPGTQSHARMQELVSRGANPMGSKWELSETLREELMAERSAALEALNPM